MISSAVTCQILSKCLNLVLLSLQLIFSYYQLLFILSVKWYQEKTSKLLSMQTMDKTVITQMGKGKFVFGNLELLLS